MIGGGDWIYSSTTPASRDTLLLRLSEQAWDDVLESICAARSSAQSMHETMMRGLGRIVNLSPSIIPRDRNPGQTNYSASKAALSPQQSLPKRLFARHNSQCGSSCYIRTQMTDVLPEEVKNKFVELIALPAGELRKSRRLLRFSQRPGFLCHGQVIASMRHVGVSRASPGSGPGRIHVDMSTSGQVKCGSHYGKRKIGFRRKFREHAASFRQAGGDRQDTC